MTDAALRIENLRVRYGPREVLHGVTVQARLGEVTAIVGPNASGKSTLLKAAAGLVPFDGTIEYGDVVAGSLSRSDRARRVAYVPQRTELEAAQSVREVVAQGRFPYHGFGSPSRTDHEAVDGALDAAGVASLEHRPFTELSGGEQRRVLVARALATHAAVLLLDEPTASLDVAHVLAMHDLLRGLARDGRAVVVVLHALDDVRARTDRAYLLSAGRLVAEGASAEVVSADAVRAVYDVELVEGGAIGFQRPGGTP